MGTKARALRLTHPAEANTSVNRKWVIALGTIAVFGFVAMAAIALVIRGGPAAGLLATVVIIFGLVLVELIKRFCRLRPDATGTDPLVYFAR